MKPTRRRAREDAMQILYQLDFNEGLTPEAALFHFERNFLRDSTCLDPFTQRLVSGVASHLGDIDKTIAGFSENWRTNRMPVVDRNILRLGVFELQYCDDIPATVTINEMIEIAKQFGSENSPSFINGILDRVKNSAARPGKAP